MATMLIGTAIGATSAVRVTAVRPRAGAGARAFAFGASNAASPSRVAGLGRRGTVRVAELRRKLREGVAVVQPAV